MSAHRSRVVLASLGMMLAIGLGSAAPALGADNPVGAIDELIERVREGRFDALDEIVCAAEQDAVRAAFDISALLEETPGIDETQFADALSLELEHVSTELLSEDGDQALVRLEVQMTRSMERPAAERFVREIAEALGEPVSDERLADQVDSMLESFAQVQTLDEQVMIVREDGVWLVCDPLGQAPDGVGPIDDGSSLGGQVSFEGLCGLVTLDQVNSTGPLTYDSSAGFVDSCSYFNSGLDAYFSLAASVDRSTDIEAYASIYPSLDEVMVAGRAGLQSDDLLLAGLPDGSTLVTTLFIDDIDTLGVEVDVRAHMLAFAELLAPVIPAQAPDATLDPSDDVGLFYDQLPLCDALPLERLNGLSDVQYDTVEGEGEFCSYSSTDFSDGFSFVTLTLAPESDVEEFAESLPGGEELFVGGERAYLFEEQLFVETEQGLLSVGAFATDEQGDLIGDVRGYSIGIAMAVMETLGDLEPGTGQTGSDSGDGPDDDRLVASEGSLCELVSVESINALGPLQYDDVFDGGPDLCVYSATVPEQGSHSLSIFTELFSLEELIDIYDSGTADIIGGLPTYAQDETLWIDLGDRVLAVSPFLDDAIIDPGTDILGFAAQVAALVAESASSE